MLMQFGIISEPINFLADTNTGARRVILGNIWVGIPFNMIILLSGLQSIDEDLYESAVIDGAGKFARFRYITWPLLMPTILVLLLLGFIYTFKVFDIIYAMTSGGPANSSQILPYYSYELSFKMFKFGEVAGSLVRILCNRGCFGNDLCLFFKERGGGINDCGKKKI